MKLSVYNEFIALDNKHYLFNLMNNTLVAISDILKTQLEDKKFDEINEAYTKQLKNMGFLLDDNFDEIEFLKLAHNTTKYDQHQRSFIVYPTLKCNLDCPYCFEKAERKTIDKQRQTLLNRFLLTQADNNKLTNFQVRWSGGEPLLLWDFIKNTNFQLQQICKKNNINYSTTMCTNGTLIKDEKIALEIFNCNFESITISIDGDRKTNNKRRFYKQQKGSFDDIINGINNISKYQEIIVRINIDKENVLCFENFLQEIDDCLKYKSNIKLYIKPISAAWGCEYDESLYKDADFFQIENQLFNLAKLHQYDVIIHNGFKHYTRCLAYQVMSFLFDPVLNLFKCPLFIGRKEKRIGFINENSESIITDVAECMKFTNLSPYENEECLNCKILPLCNGKCTVKWEQLNFKENQGCIPEKETLIEKLQKFYIPKLI
jgi:uncharacterized protein